jgi:prepilin-type N-terminal cleavage/methylation domain-containing protein
MLSKRKNKAGLTLAELLVVTAMLSVVSLAMYSIAQNGLRVWQKINKPLVEEDLNVFLDKFSHSIKNASVFSGMQFSGSEAVLEFPALVRSRRMQKLIVGKVIYSYDDQKKLLVCSESDFSQVYSSGEATMVKALSQVVSLKFSYYDYDSVKKEYLWRESWFAEAMPLAVRMELELRDGENVYPVVRTVTLPMGG